MPNWKKVIVSGSDALLRNVTASDEVIAHKDQRYKWGGWDTVQDAESGFTIIGNDFSYTNVTPQIAGGDLKWHILGSPAHPNVLGKLDTVKRHLVFNTSVYVLGDSSEGGGVIDGDGNGGFGGGGNGGTSNDGSVGGLVIEGGGLQLKTTSSGEAAGMSFVPGDDGPTMYFFERGDLTTEQSGSFNHNSASAKIVFNTSSQALKIFAGSTDETLKEVLHISKSGDNPRIGVGTTNPKSTFEFRETSDTVKGSELVLAGSRTAKGAIVGDSAGTLNFAVPTGSANILDSGSVGKIKGVVTNETATGVQGKLVFEVFKDTHSSLDTIEFGYGLGNNSLGTAVMTSSLELKDTSPTGHSKFNMFDSSNNLKFEVLEGNITASGNISASGELIGTINGGTF